MLLLLLLQLINYMNDKFQKYKDVLSPQEDKIRLKRRINETNENISGLLSPRWTESGRNKTLHPTINRGPGENKILTKNNFTRSHSIGMLLCFYAFTIYYYQTYRTDSFRKHNKYNT